MTLIHPYSLGPMFFEDFWGLGGLIMMISRKPSPRCWGAPDGADMCGDGAPRDLRWQQGQYVLCLSMFVSDVAIQWLLRPYYLRIAGILGNNELQTRQYDKPWQLHEFDAMCNGPIAALLREPEKHAICMKGMMANSEVVHFRWFPRGSCYTMLYWYFSSFDVTGQGMATGSTGLSQPNETISSIQHTDEKYQTSLFAEGL